MNGKTITENKKGRPQNQSRKRIKPQPTHPRYHHQDSAELDSQMHQATANLLYHQQAPQAQQATANPN